MIIYISYVLHMLNLFALSCRIPHEFYIVAKIMVCFGKHGGFWCIWARTGGCCCICSRLACISMIAIVNTFHAYMKLI
jgi:hypothetical protein